jgi:two-component system cell cycle sensor histidine kinase/response regulator CckA
LIVHPLQEAAAHSCSNGETPPGLRDEFCRQIVEYFPEAILLLRDGVLAFANTAAVKLLGEPESGILGRNITDFLLPNRALSSPPSDADAVQRWEDRLVRADGSVVDVGVIRTELTDGGAPAVQLIVRDITSRKQVEAALENSERTLSEAQRLTSIGSWECELPADRETGGLKSRWSDQVYRILGIEPGSTEPSYKRFYESVHPEDRDRVREVMSTAIEANEPYSVDHRVLRPDGTEAYVHQEAHVIRDEAGRPLKMIGVIQDITERKYVEEALRESQGKWRALAENAPDTIMTIDRDGTILFINRPGSQQRRDIFIGATVFDFMAPEFRESTKRLLESVFESGTPVSFEYARHGTDDVTHWYASRMGPIRSEQNIVAVALISSDITKRKADEADLLAWKNRYEAVIQASGQIIYDWDPIRNHVTFGGSVENTLGYRADEMPHTIESWGELVHPEDREEFLLRSGRLSSESADFHQEYRIRKMNGDYVVVKDDGYVTSDSAGNVQQVLGFVADISQQRTLETQLRHSQKMEAFGRLAGGVAHDFNNLLTVIAGYNDIVLHDLGANDPRRECVEEIGKAADRASALTAQLLAFSRQQVLQPRLLDLNSVLSDTGKMLRRLIGEDIHLIIQPTENLGYVKADLGQLENVLVNLAVNARDAMPEGGTLTIGTARTVVGADHPEVARGLAPGEYIRLSVSDTGVGMSESVKDRIFEPFFTTKAVGHGTGLGLATCYGIVKQSEGHIVVESQIGRGATFHIYLPRVEDTPEEISARAEMSSMAGGTETILVVEDEPAVRRLAVSILKGLGYTVLEAANGEEAFMIMQTPEGQNLDLVVTDIVMPEMGGKDLAYWIRSSHPNAKILFTSGYPDHALDDHSDFGGDTEFMPKPYSPKQFASRVRGMLDA